jgi:ABC-type Mn2+/Zn2+ transport system ATPase subunit
MNQTLIELEQAVFGYGGVPVVSVDALQLHAGECVGIFGPNGSGKTTLVRGIAGLLAPLEGRVVRQDGFRVAYLPQQDAMQAHWPMSGFDAAAMVVSSHRTLGWLTASDRTAVRDMMRRLIVDDLADRQFFRLSGGQQQRLLLAAALAVRPQVLMLDEPTAGLDLASRTILLDALREFTTQGLCAVMISHEIEDLAEVSRRVAWIHPADRPQAPAQVEITQPNQLIARLSIQR